MNPMELYHNQVTRTQGPFSLRMFHRSWGIMLIQANIEAPCTLLDFPTLDRFIDEIRDHQYDVIGITSIIPNLFKVKKMCELIRQYQPQAKIVVGGHIANIPDLPTSIDADHVVRGEGVHWFRRYLGESPSGPIRHPAVNRASARGTWASRSDERPATWPPASIPSVGCPLGCNFCSTSAMFGGKGKSLQLLRDRRRAVRRHVPAGTRDGRPVVLLHGRELPAAPQAGPAPAGTDGEARQGLGLYVFSSANVLRSYTIDQLVRLGVSWVWMGIEGCNSQYVKLQGIDTFDLVRELQSHGIRVLGSTIIGLEEPHAGEHRRGDRACRPARYRLPPVHALHADPRHAAARRADGRKDPR